MLPFSEACERNKDPILSVLRGALAHGREVLEIGSGTGQHALHFVRHLPHLHWQPSETVENLAALRARIAADGGPANLLAPVLLDVRVHPWPVADVDAVFSANTLHIMSWQAVHDFFRGVGRVLKSEGVLAVYGPFRYAGRYTSESNAAFDRYLQERDPLSGIRDFEAVDALARKEGLQLDSDHDMPAHNRTLVWRRASIAPVALMR
jgi:cyclopropane fatty-acyl-phospholipid synthase-like methyltransferase